MPKIKLKYLKTFKACIVRHFPEDYLIIQDDNALVHHVRVVQEYLN